MKRTNLIDLKIYLTIDEFEALKAAADKDIRFFEIEARFILREELLRRGLLSENNDFSMIEFKYAVADRER